MPGDYRISETVVFDERDAGTAANPITYKSWGTPGSARLTGGRLLKDWTSVGNGVYKTSVPSFVHAVYENGVPAVIAREPDPGEGEAPIGCNLLEGGSNASDVRFKPGQYKRFDFADVLLRLWPENWQYRNLPVKSIDFENRVITIAGQRESAGRNTRFFLQHAREFIDKPGEFYVDSSSNTLYYKPRTEPIADQNIVFPSVGTILQIAGSSKTTPVRHLRFEGLAVSEVDCMMPGTREWRTRAKSVWNANGWPTRAIGVWNADSIELRSLLVENAGDSGIFVWHGTSNLRVSDSVIRNARLNGIRAASIWKLRSYTDEKTTPIDYGITDLTISNCAISDVEKYGIDFMAVKDADIGFCEVFNCDKLGIYMITSEGCVVHHNNIHHVASNYKDVAGALYCNVIARRNRFEDNRIHDVANLDHSKGTPARAIYLDYDGNFDITVKNNVVYNMDPGVTPIKLGGERILLDNNIIDNRGNKGRAQKLEFWGGSHRLRWVAWLKGKIMHDRDMTFTHNIFLNSLAGGADFIYFNSIRGWSDTVKVGTIPEVLLKSDHNLFFNSDVALSEYKVCNHSVEDWRALGDRNYDANSQFGKDPLFVDVDKHDYRFAPRSPARALGIVESDAATASGVGLRRGFPYHHILDLKVGSRDQK
jgi:hypothetical protein